MGEIYLTGLFLLVLFLLLGTGVWVGLALLGVAWCRHGAVHLAPGGRRDDHHDLAGLLLLVADRLAAVHLDGRNPVPHATFRGHVQGPVSLDGATCRAALLHTNIVGCTVFAAVSGSSAATADHGRQDVDPGAAQTRLPEHMIIGTLAGAATLGLMIPPSLTLIVYGVTIKESITKLFMAGILPGLMLASHVHGLYRALVLRPAGLRCRHRNRRMTFAEQRPRKSRFLIPSSASS